MMEEKARQEQEVIDRQRELREQEERLRLEQEEVQRKREEVERKMREASSSSSVSLAAVVGETLEREYQCPACLDLFICPIVLNCGHSSSAGCAWPSGRTVTGGPGATSGPVLSAGRPSVTRTESTPLTAPSTPSWRSSDLRGRRRGRRRFPSGKVRARRVGLAGSF